MRLLFYIHSLRSGGAERVLAKLANHFATAGHDVAVLTQVSLGDDHYPIDENVTRLSLDAGTPSKNLLDAILNNLRRFTRLRRTFKSFAPDHVIAFMPTASVLALAASRGLGFKVTVSERVHPPFSEVTYIRRLAQRKLYPKADNVVVLAQESADWVTDQWGLENTRVIPNSVSLPLPEAPPMAHPADYVPDSSPLVLFVGRMVPQKQPLLALAFFSTLTENHPDMRMIMVGRGPLAGELAQQIETLKLTDVVTHVEHIGNLQAFYERADIFLSTSLYEGSPNALMEAMACGCACVAFDCPTGPKYLLNNGENGFLVPLSDQTEYRERMAQLAADRELRTTLGGAARGIVHSQSQAAFVARWSEVLGI